jgi:hypothetical protein
VFKEDFAASTLYVLITPRPIELTFNLVRAGGSNTPGASEATAVPRPEAALDFSPLRSGQIVV